MPSRPALALALLAAVALPATAGAATSTDRVIAEVGAPLDVGVDGPVVAYSRRVGAGAVEIVVRDGLRPELRLTAGRGTGRVDVGRDGFNGRVVVFVRCRPRCDLVAYSPAVMRFRVVAAGVRAGDVAVGRNRAFWIDGRRVRSRSLAGGPTRREAVAKGLIPSELGTDGTTLAVTGDVPQPASTDNATGLSVTRVGSGRARLRGTRAFSQDYTAIRAPVVTSRGVTTLFDVLVPDVATSFADFAAGGRDLSQRTTGGMQVVAWDAAGDSAVFIEAATEIGCGVGDTIPAERVAAAPCRIVVADLGGPRLLPPHVTVTGRTATVLQRMASRARVTSQRPLAGVPVELRRGGQVVGRLTTDGYGRVTLPAPDGPPLAVVALTVPQSYAYYGSG